MTYYSKYFTGYHMYYPRSLDSISILHSEYTFSTHWGAFWLGTTSGAHTCHIKRQITFASYRVPIYTPGWRAAMWIECLAEGQKCRALKGIEPATLWSRVKGSIQYTTAPPSKSLQLVTSPTPRHSPLMSHHDESQSTHHTLDPYTSHMISGIYWNLVFFAYLTMPGLVMWPPTWWLHLITWLLCIYLYSPHIWWCVVWSCDHPPDDYISSPDYFAFTCTHHIFDDAWSGHVITHLMTTSHHLITPHLLVLTTYLMMPALPGSCLSSSSTMFLLRLKWNWPWNWAMPPWHTQRFTNSFRSLPETNEMDFRNWKRRKEI